MSEAVDQDEIGMQCPQVLDITELYCKINKCYYKSNALNFRMYVLKHGVVHTSLSIQNNNSS